MKTISQSTENTLNLAKQIASKLKGGEILALSGELGSGKTTFVQGLADYFGIASQVSSPTFTLINEYQVDGIKFPITGLVHADCYRLENGLELEEIGVAEYFEDPEAVVIIEWAERVKEIIPAKAIWFKFEHGRDGNQRIITQS